MAGLAGQPEDVELLRVAGRAGVEMGADDAVEQLRKVTELRPDDADRPGSDLGDALATEGRDEEAAEAFRKTLELNPDDELALTHLGHAAYASGQDDDAVAYLAQAAERAAGASTAAISLVDMYRDARPVRGGPGRRPQGRRRRARRRRRRARRGRAEPGPSASSTRRPRPSSACARSTRPARARGLCPARDDPGRACARETGPGRSSWPARPRRRPPRPHQRVCAFLEARARVTASPRSLRRRARRSTPRCRASQTEHRPPARARTGACEAEDPLAEVATPSRAMSAEWRRCPACEAFVYHKRLKRNLGVCPECNHHFRLPAARAAGAAARPGQLRGAAAATSSRSTRSSFVDSQALPRADRAGPAQDRREVRARSTARATIDGQPLVVAGIDFGFIGGSMGGAVGEAITRAAELALEPSARRCW